ncbi:MAG: desulfoferrodoxin family protein [Lachnospirales bacterium]
MKFFKKVDSKEVVTEFEKAYDEKGEYVEVVANSTDAAVEKHVPVVEVNGSVVKVVVSDVTHPMLDTHFIQWILIETEKGHQKKDLAYTDEPVAEFTLGEDDKVLRAYEYCNLHGLWVKEV